MEQELKRVFEKYQKMGWITFNEHLEPEAIYRDFGKELFAEMTVKRFLEMFYPRDL